MPKEIGKDQQHIDALNLQAWNVRVSDSILAHQLSKEALQLATQQDYIKGKAEALRTYGFTEIRMSRFVEAQNYLNQSLALFEELNDLDGQSDVYEFFGIIRRSLGDLGASLNFLFQSLEYRQQTSYKEGESLSYYHLGVTYKYLGQYDKALDYLLKSLTIARKRYWVAESYSLNLIGQIYFETEEYHQALAYYEQSLILRNQSGDKWGEAGCLDNMGFAFFKIGDHEQAIDYCTKSLSISQDIGDKKGQGNTLLHLSLIYFKKGELKQAFENSHQSLQIRQEIGDKKGEAEALLFLSELQTAAPEEDTNLSFQFLNKATEHAESIGALDLLTQVHLQYYKTYKQCNNFEKALQHLEKYGELEKEMHRDALTQKVLNLEVVHKAEQSQKEAEIYRLRNVELAGLYEESEKQKKEIELQKNRAEESLVQLRQTQTQLIQKEKMASLGELTAGIAHEIQNPLNFINNFSEVSSELTIELKDEISTLPLSEYQKNNIAFLLEDLIQNQQKIFHHGRRADAIVKGMLQHSRKSTGQKEAINLNALVNEYYRLAYHSYRTKDKNFNASVRTHFDEGIKEIDVVPQELGQVLLNLFNNAFYSISTKARQLSNGYEPIVLVRTSKKKNNVEICIKDNGVGISQKIVDKIFQPFFTTKSTGEGTGLGLSLSYDIITKGHGGELRVETKEGEYAEFVIQLPG